MGNSGVSRCDDLERVPPDGDFPDSDTAPTALYDVMRDNPASQSLFNNSMHGDVKAAMRDLMEKAAPNCCNPEGLTPLMVAAAGGHVEVAQLLITSHAQVNLSPCRLGVTPLSFAAAQGNVALVNLLCQQKADPNVGRRSSNAPLSRAAAVGHFDVCRTLLDFGADLHSYDEDRGMTAIAFAIDHEHLKVTQLLLQSGAGMAHADHGGRSALSHAVDALLRMIAYEKMLAAGKSGSPEHFAYHNWSEVASIMAGKKADLNIIDAAGDSLLCRALRQRRDDVVVLLLGLQADANLRVPSLDEGPVLHLTITHGPRDLCYRLIARHASVNQATRSGVTPLHLALETCDEDLCFHLLKCRADPQIWDPRTGETTRIKAAANGLFRLYGVLEPYIAITATSEKRKYAFADRNSGPFAVTK